MLYPALRRKRAPNGIVLQLPVAVWRAGQIWDAPAQPRVKRTAWLMSPAWISSTRTKPGMMGSPAASAEVQPSGRSAFEPRLNTAPEPPVGLPLFQLA